MAVERVYVSLDAGQGKISEEKKGFHKMEALSARKQSPSLDFKPTPVMFVVQR